jgi:hypothetical protein
VDWLKHILKLFPKLTKYQTTNILFELMALFYTLKFTAQGRSELLATLTWLFVVLLGFRCVTWACRL